jgi:Immunoglobulin I-set domain
VNFNVRWGFWFSIRLAVVFSFLWWPRSSTAQTPVVINPGWNLIANPLNNPAGNALNSILLTNVTPSLPDGCRLFKYLGSPTYPPPSLGAIYVQSRNTWVPSDITLEPGEGAALFNPSPSGFTVQFSGVALPRRATPYPLTYGGIYLLSDPANEVSTYDLMMGSPPTDSVRLFQWNGTNYDYYSIRTNGMGLYWYPAVPSISIGQSVWIVDSPYGPPPLPTGAGILIQPRSRTNDCGSAASFTVRATGTPPLSFQWCKNGQPLTDGGILSGTATPTLSFGFVSTNELAVYTVVITNLMGAVISTPAILTFRDLHPPAFLAQPYNQTVRPGATVCIGVGAFGSPPLTYQWWQNDHPLSDGGMISGANSNLLTLRSVTTNESASYSVVVASDLGSLTSDSAILNVTLSGPDPNALTIYPGWNLIANQLNHPNGNTLNNIMLTNVTPPLPDGCQLFKFVNNTTNGSPWVPSIYRAAWGSWVPGDVTLNPGEGAYLLNSSTAPFSISLIGTAMSRRSEPYPNVWGGMLLLSGQGFEPSTFELIYGGPAQVNDQVFQWNKLYAAYSIYAYALIKGPPGEGWSPSAPAIPIGQSVWIKVAGNYGWVPPAPVYLSVQLSNNFAALQWNVVPFMTSTVLQFSTNLVNWTDLTNASSPWPLTSGTNGSPQRFYRVRSQGWY